MKPICDVGLFFATSSVLAAHFAAAVPHIRDFIPILMRHPRSNAYAPLAIICISKGIALSTTIAARFVRMKNSHTFFAPSFLSEKCWAPLWAPPADCFFRDDVIVSMRKEFHCKIKVFVLQQQHKGKKFVHFCRQKAVISDCPAGTNNSPRAIFVI
jgi:hypothetical protein